METGNYGKTEHPTLDSVILLVYLAAVAAMVALTFFIITEFFTGMGESVLGAVENINWRYFTPMMP